MNTPVQDRHVVNMLRRVVDSVAITRHPGRLLLLFRQPGLLALLDQAVVSVTNFLTAVMIGRACGKAELGIYSLAWTLITISTGILSTLIAAPYVVFGPQMPRSRRRRYLGSILVHQSLLSVAFALTLCTIALVGRWYGVLSNAITDVGTTTAAVIVFISLKESIRTVSFTELKVGWALSVDLTSTLAQAGAMLLLIQWGALTVSSTYAVVGIASALAAGIWLFLHHSSFRFDRRLFLADLRRNWNFGKWILGSGLLWQAAGYLFPWILAFYRGKATTGVWAACSAIVALGNPVLLGLSNYALPKLSTVYATAGVQSMKRYVLRYSLLFVALLLPVVIVVAELGEQLLRHIYGAGYGGTKGILVFLALKLLVITMAKPYAQGLFCLERARADTCVNVVWVTFMIIAGPPAVRLYGALGAAATMLSSGAIAAALKIVTFRKSAHVPATAGRQLRTT